MNVNNSKLWRELHIEEMGGETALAIRWARTHNRICPITGRHVVLDDVEKGMYFMERINGDSAYGYQVIPTTAHLMDIAQESFRRLAEEAPVEVVVATVDAITEMVRDRERVEKQFP